MADRISVACKLPSGFTIDHKGERLTLNGPNDAGAMLGFGVTRDVDADWFFDWVEGRDDEGKPIGVGRNFAPIASGAIFPIDSSDIAGAVRERAPEVHTGLEPLNPDAPMEGIEPTEEQRKELAKAATEGEPAPAAPKGGRKPGEAKK